MSDKELQRFAEEHILYEAGMLHSLGVKLMNRQHEDDPVVENTLLESFAVHARLVLDFLYVDEPRVATDAVASDYFDDDTWQRARPAKSERLEGILAAWAHRVPRREPEQPPSRNGGAVPPDPVGYRSSSDAIRAAIGGGATACGRSDQERTRG